MINFQSIYSKVFIYDKCYYNSNWNINIYVRNSFASILFPDSKFLNLEYSIDIPILKKKLEYTFSRNRNYPFTKIYYLLFLQNHNLNNEYIWIEMSAFTNNTHEISIPKVKSIYKNIKNLVVTSNKLNFINKRFDYGYIEFTPYNYSPNSEPGVFSIDATGTYGCFKIYAYENNTKNILLAYNNHKNIPDLGIGNNLHGLYDWTFSQNSLNYNIKKFEIFTKPSKCFKYVKKNYINSLQFLASYVSNKSLLKELFNFTESSEPIFRLCFFIKIKTSKFNNWLMISCNIQTTNKFFSDTNTKSKVTNIHVLDNFDKVSYFDSGILEFCCTDYIPISSLPFNSTTFLNTGNHGTFRLISDNNIIFSINNIYSLDGPDVGFGNNSNGLLDWSFSFNKVKLNLEIFSDISSLYPDIIILVSGQSNSQGWGGIYEHIPSDDIHPNILGWDTESNLWKVFDLKNSIGTKPKNMQNFAFHFAKRMIIDKPNIKIGIIIHGLGGQPISRWTLPNPNLIPSIDINKKDDGDIYRDIVDIVSNCVKITNTYTNTRIPSKLHSILWHQGEADYLESFEYYQQRLICLINKFRSESFCSFNTPFILGELLDNFPYNKQNFVIDKFNTNSIKCARTKNLPCNFNDVLHFSTQSHRLMGSLYYDKYKEI